MNCSENEYVCSVKKENNLGFYRLHTIWKDDGFSLNVTSKDGAWRGELTSDDVKNMSNQLDVEPSLYLQQCKDALTAHDGCPGMTYSVENGSFTWKKIVDEDSGIKIKMGSVMLKPASFVDTIQNLVQVALNCNKKLEEELKRLNKENQKNMSEKDVVLNKLNEFIQTKETMENDLYNRFILLLNSKKRKIMELETALEENKTKIENIYVNKDAEIHQKDPYEVDTENDDCVLEAELEDKNLKKSKIKSDKQLKIRTKVRRKSSFSPSKDLEGKKTKKSAKDDESKSGFDSLDLSSDLIKSPPGKIPQSESPVKKKTEIPYTKDELLNFFYGESSHDT